MRLTKARIQNYRSIIDTGEFEIEKIKTILVGINEAGKTAILKALHQLNPGSDNEEVNLLRDYPRIKYASYTKGRSEEELNNTYLVTGHFILEQSDIDSIKSDVDNISDSIDLSKIIYEKVKCYKTFRESLTGLNRYTWEDIGKDILRLIESLKQIESAVELVTSFNKKLETSPGKNYFISVKDGVELLNLIDKAEITIDEDNEKEQKRIEELQKKININIDYGKILSYCSSNLPKFIYFNNYIRVKPIVHLEQLAQRQEQKLIDDKYYDYGNLSLLKYLGYSAKELSDLGKANEQQRDLEQYRKSKDERQYRLNAASIELTKHIKEVWNPKDEKDEASSLKVIVDGQYLKVVVVDQLQAEIELDQRSEGFQWIVSFFIIFESQADQDFKNSILLLDEPATSLHALKQREFIKTISKIAENNQTIYTTHSPFMISQDELDLVRIVELTNRGIGTKVNNKIISNDPAALFPLQEALGYNLAQSMFTAKRNVLLEGLTDLWYLEGINSLLENRLDLNIALLPVGSSGKISYYANMLYHNDLKTVAFLDSDQAGNDAAQQEIVINTLGVKNILRAKDFCENGIQAAEVEDILRDTLIGIFENLYSKVISNEDTKSTKPIVDVFKKYEDDFSKYKLAKAFLNWAKEKSLKDLTDNEQKNCQKLIETINRRLK